MARYLLDTNILIAYGKQRPEVEQRLSRLPAADIRRGQIIGPNDLIIAAQALASGSVLVTDNVGAFSRVSGLVVENWLA